MFQSAVLRARKNLVPVGIARRHPGLHAGLGEWLNHLVEAGDVPVVPGHGDHVFGQACDGSGVFAADVAPEQQAAMQRLKLIVNLLEEGDVDGAVSLRLHLHPACGRRPGPRFHPRRCG